VHRGGKGIGVLLEVHGDLRRSQVCEEPDHAEVGRRFSGIHSDGQQPLCYSIISGPCSSRFATGLTGARSLAAPAPAASFRDDPPEPLLAAISIVAGRGELLPRGHETPDRRFTRVARHSRQKQGFRQLTRGRQATATSAAIGLELFVVAVPVYSMRGWAS
jgi:hypothetical protein